ncbi:MAG TPA: tripartite tricarboxylate transporter substrate binding protein [Burkholderiales bacterium]|nr:tripartite tricarboxylate transporter substrate binding protein [Burkholderiales bacterium]
MTAAKPLLATLSVATLFLLCCYGSLASAQTPPAKQFRVILTYPPGGASDIMGRIIAQKLGEIWGQTVLVENRSGANGSIGIEYAARQTADGSSFVIGNLGPIAINPLISKVPYDIPRDFQPVSLVAIGPTVLVTHPSMPARNLKEFVQLAREKPGAINFGTAGPGTLGHLGGEMMKRLAKIDIVHVPYKGGVLAIQDLLGGHVQMVFADPQPIIPHIRAGKAKPLAVTSAKRSSAVPDIPTFAEAGLPGFVAENWWGVWMPAATPKAAVDRVHATLTQAMTSAEIREKFQGMGIEALSSTPDALRDFTRAESDKWGKLVREANIRAD